jgi:PAS domain S-box-containing protein
MTLSEIFAVSQITTWRVKPLLKTVIDQNTRNREWLSCFKDLVKNEFPKEHSVFSEDLNKWITIQASLPGNGILTTLLFGNQDHIPEYGTNNTSSKADHFVHKPISDDLEKYMAMYNHAPLSFQSLDENGCFIDINPMWLKVMGYTREEVIGTWFGSHLHPDYVEHFRNNFPEFKKRGYISGIEFRMKRKDGNYIYVAYEGCIGYTPDRKV